MDKIQIVYESFFSPFFVALGSILVIIVIFPLIVGLSVIVLLSVIDCWIIGFRALLRLGKYFKKRS